MYQFVFRCSEEMKSILKEEARTRGQTLTGFIKQILWEWIENKVK